MENKERIEELIKIFDPFGIKNFKDVLNKIKEELEYELDKNNKNKNNEESEESDDEKEFNEEIKQRNKNNIIKIYKRFKLKKGIE